MLNLNFQNGQAPALNARNMNAIVESINTMQTQLANPFTYKGVVASVANLPSSGNTINDTYYVTAETCLYSWNGTAWSVASMSESEYLAMLQNILDDIAAEYDSTSTYSIGDYCIYNEKLYRCITAITTAEAWTAGHWVIVDVMGEVTDLKSALDDQIPQSISYAKQIGAIEITHKVNSIQWEADESRGYGFITSDFLLTELVDKMFIYNTDTYRAYIYYYDDNHDRQAYYYISDDSERTINKTYKYFKIWVYNRDTTSPESLDVVTSNVRIESSCEISNVVSDTNIDVDNVLQYNGEWKTDISIIVGGYSLAQARVGSKIFASAALTRARTTNPIYVRHDNAIFRSGLLNTYPFMWAKVDDNDNLLAFGGYVRTAVLSKGKYYFLFKSSSGSAITEQDITAIKNAFTGYYYFDDGAESLNYSELYCGNWYVETDGVVSLGDSGWNTIDSSITAVVIPPFYTNHNIYIRNDDPNYRWRDSVSDENGNITKSTGYISGSALTEVSAGYHHIMVTRAAGVSEYDLAEMCNALSIFATKSESSGVQKTGNVIARNIDMQNALYALRKSERSGNSLNRTVFIAHPTDSHGDAPRWHNFLDAIDYYLPDIVIHTGDMVNYTMLSDTTHFLNHLPSMPTLLAIGNHETGVNHDIGSGGATNDTLFEDLIEPLNEKYNLGATKTYYSYSVHGMKFIILNVYDYDENDGTHFVDRTHIYYSQAQVTWLIGELQDALTNDTPVVVCAHECDAYLEPSAGGETPFNQTYELQRFYSKTWEGNPICDLLEAFISGTSINKTYNETGSGITLTVNTSFSQPGHFVTWLVGHRHADFMGFLPSYSQLVISPCATACSIDTPNSTGGYSDLPRRENERCEDAFNFYAINPHTKKIGIVRFGSNINFDLRNRKYYVTSYVKET